MVELKITSDLSTDGGLFFSGTFDLDGENVHKTVQTPVKAIPVHHLTRKDKVTDSIRSVAEVYQKVDAAKLEESRTNGNPSFLNRVSKKLTHARDDEVIFTFWGYGDAHQITREEAQELVHLSQTYSDVVTPPLQPKLLSAITGSNGDDDEFPDTPFRAYKAGIEEFLRAVDRADVSKPLMGIIPFVKYGRAMELLELYDDFDIKILGFNFDGGKPTTDSRIDKLADLFANLSAKRELEGKLFYAVNPRPSFHKDGVEFHTAEDFAPAGMGFDIIGEDHSGPTFIPDEQPDIETCKIYDRELIAYKKVPLSELWMEWPYSSEVSPDRVESASENKRRSLRRLTNSEQLQFTLEELRQAIDDGAEFEFLRSHDGITGDMRESFEEISSSVEDGMGPNLPIG